MSLALRSLPILTDSLAASSVPSDLCSQPHISFYIRRTCLPLQGPLVLESGLLGTIEANIPLPRSLTLIPPMRAPFPQKVTCSKIPGTGMVVIFGTPVLFKNVFCHKQSWTQVRIWRNEMPEHLVKSKSTTQDRIGACKNGDLRIYCSRGPFGALVNSSNVWL